MNLAHIKAASNIDGALLALDASQEEIQDVVFEIDDEAEAHSLDNWDTISKALNEVSARELVANSKLEEIIKQNSREVTIGTDLDYRRLMVAFDRYLVEKKKIKEGSSIFELKSLPPSTPLFIIAWIMDACDDTNSSDGSKKPDTMPRSTYTTAMKMRSATTYGFGRITERGTAMWQPNPDGKNCRGNPSTSTEVARYMLALKKRKHANGEISQSSRAITCDILKDIYKFNHLPENLGPVPIVQVPRQSTADKSWGGPRTRALVHAVTVLAFVCLLRSDEVLTLRVEDFEILSKYNISFALRSRKNSPFGSKPFNLFRFNDDEEHLCPIRALAKWISVSEITSGYIFPNIDGKDRPQPSEDKHMTHSKFLELFRNSLVDVEQDPNAYGTHSLRRGGCQWLSKHRRWSIPQICLWGGWSYDFNHLTIVRYLISWNDGQTGAREDFFNPDRPPSLKCHTCGRTCWHN